jgi:hypothetical protein
MMVKGAEEREKGRGKGEEEENAEKRKVGENEAVPGAVTS